MIRKLTTILLGFLIIIFSWVMDSLADVIIFEEVDSILNSLIYPSSHNLWHRFVLTIAILGFYIYLYGIFKKLKYAEKEAYNSQAIMKSAFESTALGMCVSAMDKSYVALNNAYCEILGFTKEEMLNLSFQDFCHPEDRYLDDANVKDLLAGNITYFNSIKRYYHKNGNLIWVKATVALVRDANGKPQNFVAQVQDITSLREADEQLRQAKERAELMALTDYLTGCLNRRAFVDRLGQEIERAKREDYLLAIILVDIDNFKLINDQFGHITGDYVIQQFSHSLVKNCRTYDFVGRYGGEEFVICLPNVNLKGALVVAERMREEVKNMCLQPINSISNTCCEIKLTGSFGVTILRFEEDETIDTLIARADEAMYKAKQQRNTLCIA